MSIGTVRIAVTVRSLLDEQNTTRRSKKMSVSKRALFPEAYCFMGDEEDKRKCQSCGRLVNRDELTDSGCLICEQGDEE